MEDIPPSYYQSTNPSVLDLIAPYLDTPSLHALILVSRSYNETFMPHLWGSPASHFVPMTGPTSPGLPRTHTVQSSYNDLVYIALTRFKRILKIARESTRRLVHTLYLPAAASEIYSGPNATWLRDILDGLPNLQSLCVSGLPFFDHHSLVALDRSRLPQPNQNKNQTYPVKLLLASKEPNTTSIGLSLFLPYLCNLVYLDLSYTTPARDMNVLSSFSVLDDLQILKLRGIGLRDAEATVLATSIGLRVRLLDLSENYLSDRALRSLLDTCFLHPTDNLHNGTSVNRLGGTDLSSNNQYYRRHLESWPVGLPPAPDFLSLDTLRSADFDKNLLAQLTNPLTGRLAFEDIPHSGLTHLYITGNPAITFDGVRALLAVGRLHVLDAGDIAGETAIDKYVKSVRDPVKFRDRPRSVSSGTASLPVSRLSDGREGTEDDISPVDEMGPSSRAEKLIPVLREKASKCLTYLRIEHAIITKEAEMVQTREKKLSTKVELSAGRLPAEMNAVSGEAELVEIPGSRYHAVEAYGSSHQPVELATDPGVFELDATPVVRVELPGDLIHFAISPPIGEKPEPQACSEASVSPIRGEGPYAPEVVGEDHDSDQDEQVVLDATRAATRLTLLTNPGTASTGVVEPHSLTIDGVLRSHQGNIMNRGHPPSIDHTSQIEGLLQKRPKSTSLWLHPSSLPNLRALVLTNVPDKIAGSSSPILTSIKDFISACATESFIAVLQARTNYSLPPGRARAAAERKHAQTLFALRTIVLEVSPVEDRQRDWKHTRQRLNISKSSTGDHDSEALWSAAENDFSFFGEEGEEHDECGIYDHEPGKYFPSVHFDDKFAITADDLSRTPPGLGFNLPSNFSPNSASGTMFRSPRELPLGRNRRASNETRNSDSLSTPNRSSFHEMMGNIPTSQPRAPQPTSAPQKRQPPQMVDLIAELSKWRKERKAAFEEELRRRGRVNGVTMTSRIANTEVYVEGHWKGEIRVVRNSKPSGSGMNRGQGRLERNGMVDVYGNYFEKGYLYS